MDDGWKSLMAYKGKYRKHLKAVQTMIRVEGWRKHVPSATDGDDITMTQIFNVFVKEILQIDVKGKRVTDKTIREKMEKYLVENGQQNVEWFKSICMVTRIQRLRHGKDLHFQTKKPRRDYMAAIKYMAAKLKDMNKFDIKWSHLNLSNV